MFLQSTPPQEGEIFLHGNDIFFLDSCFFPYTKKLLEVSDHSVEEIQYESTTLTAWAVRAELHYFGKIEIQKRPALFRNPQSFLDCSMER